MKKFALILILTLISTNVFAGTKVAIVDWKEIIEKSTATASLRRQIVTEHEKLKKEFERNSVQFKKEEQGLIQQKAVLSQEAFKEKVIAFKKKILAQDKAMQQKITAVDNKGKQALKEVKEVISKIVKEVSKSKDIDLVIPKASTIYSVDKLYITSDIIEELNQKLPDVKVQLGK